MPDCDIKQSASFTCKGVARSFKMVQGSFGWRIGNGEQASLWFDTWLAIDPLCLLVDDTYPLDITWTVANIIINDAWDL